MASPSLPGGGGGGGGRGGGGRPTNTRVYRYVLLSSLWIFAYTMHYLCAELFGPGSIFRTLTDGASVGGTTAAQVHTQIYTILSLWIPLGIAFFAIAWVLLQEYRDMRVAGVTGRI